MTPPPARPEPPVPVVRSAGLFRESREVIIMHHEEQYRLRLTRADKLILTK